MAPALTAEQLAELRVHATAGAMAFHDTQVPEASRVDFAASFAVYHDLRRVAADVLEAACLRARELAASGGEKVKRFRIEGEYEEEYFAGTSLETVSADAWCAKAKALRDQLEAAANAPGLIPSPLAGMRSGSNPEPVFRVRRDRERS